MKYRTDLLTLVLAALLVASIDDRLRAGEIETIAGTGQATLQQAGGPALRTNINQPFGVEFGPDRALYICEVGNHRVLRLDSDSGNITTVAGTGHKGYSGDGGAATQAQLNEPYEVRFDSHGNMYFVEMKNHVVRRVDAKTGKISTVAGTGKEGFSGDGGPAIEATFSQPHSIALDGDRFLYVADIGNHRIRRVDLKNGLVDTIAGNGRKELPRDGATAKDRPILGPRALWLEGPTLWIALREGHSVWQLDLKRDTYRHIAGTGKPGYSGDGGEAEKATFNGPKGIVVGRDGSAFVVDTENQAIRQILPDGKVRTIAGRGPEARGFAGDGGPATSAKLNRTHGICIGPDGAIYLGDSENHRVRRVRLDP